MTSRQMPGWLPWWGLARLYLPVLVIAGADALTKKLALAVLFEPPQIIEVLPFLRLVPVWNSGVSFGFLRDGGALMPYRWRCWPCRLSGCLFTPGAGGIILFMVL